MRGSIKSESIHLLHIAIQSSESVVYFLDSGTLEASCFFLFLKMLYHDVS